MTCDTNTIRLFCLKERIPAPVAVKFTVSEVVTPEQSSGQKVYNRLIDTYTSRFLAVRWIERYGEREKLYRVE